MSQTVERALALLKMVAEEPHQSIVQMARRLDVHKSTASRLMQTLEEQGCVRPDEAGGFRIGPTLFALAFDALAKIDIRQVAAPHLRRLGELTSQTIHLASLEGREVFYLDKYESTQSARMYSRIGKQAPLHCTGVAKAILAFRPEEERRALANQIQYTAHTQQTITTAQDLLAELDRIRARGYALDDREHENFVHCIAAPVRMPDGQVSAAVSIATTPLSVTREELLDMVPELTRAIRDIEKDLA